MGTDIHPVLWTKHTYRDGSYYAAIEPVFRWHWDMEKEWKLRTYLGLDFGKNDFPGYGEWCEQNPGGTYVEWAMRSEARHIQLLIENPEFKKANSSLTALRERDYNFFAIVGDVRNGRGFAGVLTGSEFVPIGSSRGFAGLPFDPEDDDGEGPYDYGDHSKGWVTLRELLDYSWDTKRISTGVVPLLPSDDSFRKAKPELVNSCYAHLRLTKEEPYSWSGGISGSGIVTISTEEADAILDGKKQCVEGMHYYVQYSWPLTCRGSISAETFDAIQWLGTKLNPDDTYLVFGFDS